MKYTIKTTFYSYEIGGQDILGIKELTTSADEVNLNSIFNNLKEEIIEKNEVFVNGKKLYAFTK